MDRGLWWATVNGVVKRVKHDSATKHSTEHTHTHTNLKGKWGCFQIIILFMLKKNLGRLR